MGRYNRNGGFWSFKVSKDLAPKVWQQLSSYLICEQITKIYLI